MSAMTPNSLIITFSRSSSDSSIPSVGKFSNHPTVVSAADSSSDRKEPISASILPKLSSVRQLPVFYTSADREMATILNQARTKTVQIHHQGAKDGVKIRLPGAGNASRDVPSQTGKQQTGYIITPSGANAGENIAINGHGGLVIRARNDRRQTVTARSTPDNQLQVQVGQGKSAVQLSIQVTPQGTRGEVELQCVRNAEDEGGTTGYTVSVKRPEDESRAYKQNHGTRSLERSKSPSDRSAFSRERSESARERREGSPDRSKSSHERPECSQKQSKKSPERQRTNSTPYRHHSPLSYETEACYSRNETFPIYPDERPPSHYTETRSHEQVQARKASPMTAPKQSRQLEENYADFRRKLDTHHHKPTISYLIARRMTELFKEMRKTAEMHPPAPPFIKF